MPKGLAGSVSSNSCAQGSVYACQQIKPNHGVRAWFYNLQSLTISALADSLTTRFAILHEQKQSLYQHLQSIS